MDYISLTSGMLLCVNSILRAHPGTVYPPVLTSPIHFRYVTSGSLSFVPEPKPFGFTSFISYEQLYLKTGFTLVAGPWFRLVITSESRSIS